MPLCVLASWRYIQTRVKEFMICLLIMETAMVGVFCALDFVLFFVFWEAMLIPMALLIGVWGGPRKIYAALKFFIYTMSGSIFLLVAIIALRLQGRQLQHPRHDGRRLSRTASRYWIFLAFFISFAIKVPMFPFHTWLPAAHVEAPTAGSVLLASILLKMGTYGFLRFSLPITPYATAALHALHPLAFGRRHPLRRLDRPGPDRPQEARRLFQRRPHGLCHARHLRPEPARHRGRRAGDDQPRRHHRGAVHRRRHHLRAAAHARPGGDRRHGQDHADLRHVRRRVCAFLAGLSRHEQLHRRVPGHERRLQACHSQPGLHGHDDLRRARRGARRRLHAPHAAEGRLRRHAATPTIPGLKDLGLREILTLAPAAGLRLLDRPASRTLHPRARRQREAPARTNPTQPPAHKPPPTLSCPNAT